MQIKVEKNFCFFQIFIKSVLLLINQLFLPIYDYTSLLIYYFNLI